MCCGMSRAEPCVPAVTYGFGAGKFGAGNETRTRDPDLGKVVLYQLSYSRIEGAILRPVAAPGNGTRHSERRQSWARIAGHAARK
jgi:hypothetical protein